MEKILIVTASPKEEQSVSCKMANTFEQVYQKKNPETIIEKLCLSDIAFPPVSGDLIDHLEGKKRDKRFEEIDMLLDRFCAADRYVFAMPHWNLMVPPTVVLYALCVMRAGKCFRYTQNGPEGLLYNKKALILLASGGICETDNPVMRCYGIDWLKGLFNLCGINDIETIYAQGMEEQPERIQEIVNQAIEEVKKFTEDW